MKNFIINLENKVLRGEDITYDEALILSKIENNDELNQLWDSANRIREKLSGDVVDLCSIMNAKCGKCSEDCKFCAQSAHYNTKILEHGLVSTKEALNLALENQSKGINRFSLVTSGRGLMGEEFERVVSIYKTLNKNLKISLCASLGILNLEQLKKLKEAGVYYYHHNLETSYEYYEKICTTHSYEDRINTIKNAKKAGLKVCAGGIIGMGESFEQRLHLAFTLRELEVTSIPINILNPIKGTPMQNIERISQVDILKTIAIFRFINSKANIRLGGGRNLINEYGKKCFTVGANATISGDYLTTSGNKIKEDIEMIKKLGLKIKQ